MKLNVLILLTVGLLACGDKDDTGAAADEFDAILALTGDTTAGAEVYANTCAVCHAADGTGDSGPDLYDTTAGLSDTDLLDIILNGSGSMAAVNLGDQDAADVLAYVQDSFQ